MLVNLMVQSRNKHLAAGGEKSLWTYTLCWLSEFYYVHVLEEILACSHVYAKLGIEL